MNNSIPSLVWASGTLALTACISVFVLSIQRGLHHKGIRLEEDNDSSIHTKNDYKRDMSVPYADSNRLTRIICGTLVLVAIAAFDLYVNVQHVNDIPQETGKNLWYVTCSIFVLISWLYALVLALTSRRYQLPNEWGWLLNVHLCTIYFVGWIVSIFQFCQIVLQHPNLDWVHCLPFILRVLLGFDLVYVTATVKQGPPFLDENGRQVCNINVDSIIGILFLNWCSPVVHTVASKKGAMVDQDLPVLTPKFRASNIFYAFKVSQGKNLISRIVQANRTVFILQVCLSIVASALYYVPAFFMNRLLQFLQDYNNGIHFEHPIQYGTLIVVGMGVSIIFMNIVIAQQWYFGKLFIRTLVQH